MIPNLNFMTLEDNEEKEKVRFSQFPDNLECSLIFEGARCIVFCASIAEYGTVCYEDGETNRTIEALEVFSETVNSRWFTGIPFILLLTNADQLEHTMLRCPVSGVFKD